MEFEKCKDLLERKYQEYNQAKFIDIDPISIPHEFSKKQDIEIAAFISATLSWGNRKSIIQNSKRIMQAMDNSPHNFIVNHQDQDLKAMLNIKHRTFNTTDLLYFIHFLKFHYQQHTSLEQAFNLSTSKGVYSRLAAFHNYFFSIEHPARTRKHVSTPARNSACKRLNMFLRWMVRKDKNGVDFGLWNAISTKDLICPLDIHTSRVASKLELIPNSNAHWKNAFLLSQTLKQFDSNDPCKYDFALFGLGAEERIR